MRHGGIRVALCLAVLLSAPLHGQQVDPSLMNGRALPATELPDGTITVRIFRETVGNGVPGQQVRLTASGKTFTAVTDADGRATFPGLPRGAEGRADATVDGESLQSEPFEVPQRGGLRFVLFAGLGAAADRQQQEQADALAAPPVRGMVVLGGDTRIVAELQSDTLRLFYRLDIVNNARSRVDIGGPLIMDLPRGAAGAAIAAGGPKSATLDGARLTVGGPFDPGTTSVDVSFSLPHFEPDLVVTQTWPAAVQQWFVAVEKVADISVTSPQFRGSEERATDGGAVYTVASGDPLAAGSSLTLQFANLPVHSRVASRVALGLAAAFAVVGVWLSLRGRSAAGGARQTLVTRREALLAKLADLDASRRAGSVPDDRYQTRRQRLLADLEQIYGELDETGAHPRGGGEDVAA